MKIRTLKFSVGSIILQHLRKGKEVHVLIECDDWLIECKKLAGARRNVCGVDVEDESYFLR